MRSAIVRVRYQETDQMGIAHHANFLAWFEVGRTEFMRSCGLPYREIEEHGYRLPVIEAYVCYRRPALYDRDLSIEVLAPRLRSPRLRFDYRIYDVESGRLLAEGYTVHALVDAGGRPINLRRMKPELLHRLRTVFSS